MILKKRKKHNCAGSTLISSMIAVSMLLIALIGTSNFRYFAALDSRKAVAKVEASRIAILLCESWRGIQGDENYNPVTHLGSDINIATSTGLDVSGGYTKLGSYKIEFNSDKDSDYIINYYVTMSWKDVQTGLRELSITIAWAQRDKGDNTYNGTDKTYSLTSYVLL